MTASTSRGDPPAPPFDNKSYRRTLGCFATGVTIITTRRPGGECVGLTVNSFNSVSLDPPLVLWSLSLYSQSLPAFQEANHFAVNILASDQAHLSNRFASQQPNRFENVNITFGTGGAPLIEGCAAYLECEQQYRHYGGDHIIFLGRVMDFVATEREPLIFCKGSYAVAQPLAAGNNDGSAE
jgi:3-hydroxy-9,10-secoandrosta-1,3,5(10)-triene-9,17-dione monooxygenase reductase component